MRENFSQITCVKIVKSLREKYSDQFSLKQLFLWTRNQILHFLPVKKTKPIRENFEKYLNSPRENTKSMREKIIKSAREKVRPYVKICKKCAWKRFFVREKTQKKAKKTFHAHFWFSRRKKKHCGPQPLREYLRYWVSLYKYKTDIFIFS